jgi:hypothetical protein
MRVATVSNLAGGFITLAFLGITGVTAWAAERVAPSIYKCEVDGVMTFSDRLCGGDAELHVPGETVVNTYAAPPATSKPERSTRKPAAKRAPARTDRAEAKRVESCARYARNLKEIRSRMRAGYTAKEGERLRVRQEQVRESQRAARCR